MQRLVIDPKSIDATLVRNAADAICAGQIVAIPTDTLYGLAVDPFQLDAVQKIFSVKGRDAGRGLPVVAASVEQVERHVGPLPIAAEQLAAEFWPGPLTLILPAPPGLAADVGGPTGTIAVRVPAHEVTRALCRAVDGLITATSANRSGKPATDSPEVVASTLGASIDMLLDAGKTPGGPASTIVDVSGAEVRLVRAGPVTWESIDMCLRA
jgi:L-threonylcarbamoyladenylate synthase